MHLWMNSSLDFAIMLHSIYYINPCPGFVPRTLNPDLSAIWQRQKEPFSLRSLRDLSSLLWGLYSTSVNVSVLVFSCLKILSSFSRISGCHLESSNVFLFPRLQQSAKDFIKHCRVPLSHLLDFITLNLVSPVIGCLLDGAEVRDTMIMGLSSIFKKKHTYWITLHLV